MKRDTIQTVTLPQYEIRASSLQMIQEPRPYMSFSLRETVSL